MKYDFLKLDAFSIREYETLIYPSWRTHLPSLTNSKSIIAVGAAIASKPIGLGVAKLVSESNQAQVLSLYVKPMYRNNGVGSALLHRLEMALVQSGCTNIELSSMRNGTTTPALKQLLHKQGWSHSQAKMLVCYSTAQKLQNAPWLYAYPLPASFSSFPLVELTQAEYQTIERQQAIEPWYPESLSPFKGEMPVEPLTSLGLRYQGQVVGWIATHQIAPDTIRYTSLFVRKDLQIMGRGISLLAEAIKRQVNSEISQCTCTVSVDNKAMMSFVKRRLAPFLTHTREIERSHLSVINRHEALGTRH